MNGKPACADPVVVVERGLWLGGGGLVDKLQVHHHLGAPVLTLRQVLTQLPSAHGNRPSERIQVVLWIRSRGLQRDVVYLCWPIAPSYTSLNAGGREVSANEYGCELNVTWSPNKLRRSASIFNLWSVSISFGSGILNYAGGQIMTDPDATWTFWRPLKKKYVVKSVLRIRIRDPVPFWPLDPDPG